MQKINGTMSSEKSRIIYTWYDFSSLKKIYLPNIERQC